MRLLKIDRHSLRQDYEESSERVAGDDLNCTGVIVNNRISSVEQIRVIKVGNI